MMQSGTAIRLERAGTQSKRASGGVKSFLQQIAFGLAIVAVLPLVVPELIVIRAQSGKAGYGD